MNDPLAQFFDHPDTAFGFVQGAVARALRTHGVTVTGNDTKMIYSVKVGDRDVPQAEVELSSGTTIWRDGSSTRRQDALIKAHISLYKV